MLDSPTNLNKPKLRSYFDMDANVEYVNLGPYLIVRFKSINITLLRTIYIHLHRKKRTNSVLISF